MSESERHDISQEDPYYQHDELIGDVVLGSEPYSLRLKLHEADESFRGNEDLFPLTQRTGTRRSFHATSYVLEPEITLTAALSPTPRPAAARLVRRGPGAPLATGCWWSGTASCSTSPRSSSLQKL